MKKLALHKETFTELSNDEMRALVGAAPAPMGTVSDGSCVCWFGAALHCDVSDGSCVCGGETGTFEIVIGRTG